MKGMICTVAKMEKLLVATDGSIFSININNADITQKFT
jgi:hypothetical protein